MTQNTQDLQELNWQRVHLETIGKVASTMIKGNHTEIVNSINALHFVCAGFLDSDYKKSIKALEITKNNKLHKHDYYINLTDEEINNLTEVEQEERLSLITMNPKQIEDAFYLKQGELLSSLIKRASEGLTSSYEDSDSSYLFEKVAIEIMSGQGQNIIITGKQGSGKSGAAISVAEEVSKITGMSFYSYEHIIFTPEEMLELINDKEKFPPGSILIFDEVGVSLNSRDAMSKASKIFTKFLQTIRKRSILVIFTTPNLNFFDSQAKDCLHYWFETVRKTDKQVVVKPKTVVQMQQTGHFYYMYPIIKGAQLKKINIKKPSAKNWNQYEKLEIKFKEELAISTYYDLLELSNEEGKEDVKDFYDYKSMRDEGYIQVLIREKISLPGNRATKYEKMYQKILKQEGRTEPPINEVSQKRLAESRKKSGRKKEESKQIEP